METKKPPNAKDRQIVSGSSQPVKRLDPPLKKIKSSYIPREPEQAKPIPKPTNPKKTPSKRVQREFTRSHQTIGDFLVKVERYTKGQCSQEFEDTLVIEVLRDILSRLQTEFQNRNEIHWFLTSHWKDEFTELHIFLIADGVWKFILLHCKDVEEDNSGATTGESEVARSLATTNNSELLKKPGDKPASRRNELIRESCRKKGWGKADLEKHKWELRPLMKELDKGFPLPRGERYDRYDNYCHILDDASVAHSYYSEGDGDDPPEFRDSEEVYEHLIETLSRGVHPRQK